ncbi:ABC transporter substrate-binding protein [Sulfuriflexus sp.]|uniref:ABC transporter substrate-binding protein n=1 Tax=Sulfuriflexus sp. TaxID=2015443 RepID=UPI0028CEBFA4|nr:ABC transporter substrate-binding protein [Sulfuriflexus sp.]MDT8404525.1 ABC transporter substrate-binding protein [Sulfuriflexus sp.]
MKHKLIIALALAIGSSGFASAETIRIAVGHQSKCTDTYSAGIILKELALIQKYLPTEGKYKDVKYEFNWKDYSSGSPITNQMLANKLDFGVMGDYPLIVNGAKFQETNSLETLYIAGTGYNQRGSGNAVVVPVDSDVQTLADLKGKSISVPVGSAAWGMTLKAMQDIGMSKDDYTLKNQSPPVGAANIAQGKIDAHGDFCPWSEIMEFRGTGRKIFDGSEAGVPYLHGVVVRKDYAEKYPEVVVAFMKAVVEAGNWVHKDPVQAATLLEKWTGIEREVQYLYFSKGGALTLDPTIKPEWIDALKFDHTVLVKEKNIPPLDFDHWIYDGYIREAYKQLGIDYDKELNFTYIAEEENMKLSPAEIWHTDKGIISYASVAAMLADFEKFKKDGTLRASYVYDHSTGLKIFGKIATYVKADDGEITSFMRKVDAEKFTASAGGEIMALDTDKSSKLAQLD